MTTVGGDSRLLAAAAAASVRRIRELTAALPREGEEASHKGAG